MKVNGQLGCNLCGEIVPQDHSHSISDGNGGFTSYCSEDCYKHALQLRSHTAQRIERKLNTLSMKLSSCNPLDEFTRLLEKMNQLHEAKGHDYGDNVKSYANCRTSEDLGIPAWKGAFIRLMDKVSRIKTFARQGELKVKDESIEDTFLDLANYALICLILYREAAQFERDRDGDCRLDAAEYLLKGDLVGRIVK